MCCGCSCKEATGRPARFALLTVPPSECPNAEQPSVRTPSGRRRKAPRSSEATSEGGVFSSRTQPSLQKLYDLNTEIDSYPKYALSHAKTLTLSLSNNAAPLCGRGSLDSCANAPAGKWSRPASERTVYSERSPGQPLNILWQREPLNP